MRAAPPTGPLHDLLAILELSELPGQGPDVFIGDSQPQPHGRVFGGQVLGQTVVAATRTVAADRPVHSMHAYFLRPGDPQEPITFQVERLRDGQSFSARRVHAIQRDAPILSMIASFQRPAPGLEHFDPMPAGMPDPQSLPTLRERYGADASPTTAAWLRDRPMDLRHVEEPVFVTPAAERVTRQHLWMRSVDPMPVTDDPAADAALHAAVLAYASDFSLLEPILRGHGRTFAEPGMRLASLDHAMWWHRPARVDEWLLFVLDSPSAQGSRGLGRSAVYRQDGTLVASVAQEGMVRADLSREPGLPTTPEPSTP